MKEENLDQGDNCYSIPFGKYKGEDVVDIYEKDENYIQWVWDNINLDNYPKFAKIVENLIEYGTPF